MCVFARDHVKIFKRHLWPKTTYWSALSPLNSRSSCILLWFMLSRCCFSWLFLFISLWDLVTTTECSYTNVWVFFKPKATTILNCGITVQFDDLLGKTLAQPIDEEHLLNWFPLSKKRIWKWSLWKQSFFSLNSPNCSLDLSASCTHDLFSSCLTHSASSPVKQG